MVAARLSSSSPTCRIGPLPRSPGPPPRGGSSYRVFCGHRQRLGRRARVVAPWCEMALLPFLWAALSGSHAGFTLRFAVRWLSHHTGVPALVVAAVMVV